MGSREHPLLMRGPLVTASLAGTKTQTRRLVTAANSEARDNAGKTTREDWAHMDWARAVAASGIGPALIVPGEDTTLCRRTIWRVTPRVRPGDAIWIREAWQTGSALDDEAPSMLAAWARAGGSEPCGPLRYVADGATRDEHLLATGSHYGSTWGRGRPGIHLPRWACRLVLEVTAVRVERVQDITEEDARDEGVDPGPFGSAYADFWSLWDSINGQRPGASWAANPWVWVISYRRAEP